MTVQVEGGLLRTTLVAIAVATLGLSGPTETFKDAMASSEICRASVYLQAEKCCSIKDFYLKLLPCSLDKLVVGAKFDSSFLTSGTLT